MDADQLRDLVRERYGDPREPRFDFVAQAEAARPYDELIAGLEASFEVTEDTDLNDDVSFTFVLASAAGQWSLHLSMVGRLAALLRVLDAEVVEVVEVVDPAGRLTPEEEIVVAALHDASVALLDEATLSEPVDLALFNTDPENVRLYQALFTDVDVLPWESPPG